MQFLELHIPLIQGHRKWGMASWARFRNHPFRRMENYKFLTYVVFPLGIVLFMMSRSGLNSVIDSFPLVVYPPENLETRTLVERERARQNDRNRKQLISEVERPAKVAASPAARS